MVKYCLHSLTVPTICVINHGMFKISICLQCSWVPVLPQNSLSFQISLFSLHFINNHTHTAFGLLSSVHTHPFAVSSFPWVASLNILCVMPCQLLSGPLQSASKSHILSCTFTAQKTLYHGCVY